MAALCSPHAGEKFEAQRREMNYLLKTAQQVNSKVGINVHLSRCSPLLILACAIWCRQIANVESKCWQVTNQKVPPSY